MFFIYLVVLDGCASSPRRYKGCTICDNKKGATRGNVEMLPLILNGGGYNEGGATNNVGPPAGSTKVGKTGKRRNNENSETAGVSLSTGVQGVFYFAIVSLSFRYGNKKAGASRRRLSVI